MSGLHSKETTSISQIVSVDTVIFFRKFTRIWWMIWGLNNKRTKSRQPTSIDRFYRFFASVEFLEWKSRKGGGAYTGFIPRKPYRLTNQCLSTLSIFVDSCRNEMIKVSCEREPSDKWVISMVQSISIDIV